MELFHQQLEIWPIWGFCEFIINIYILYNHLFHKETLPLMLLWEKFHPNWEIYTNWKCCESTCDQLFENTYYFRDISVNIFSGQLPREIGDLYNLQSLWVNILHWLKRLQHLFRIVSRNNLNGPIPEEIGNLQSLRKLFAIFSL
jgi:hypothetical protein